MNFARPLSRLALVAITGCAANGVTLRSNHYRVYVPPGWQVLEEGGGPELPTLLRIPASGDRGPAVELRIYPWWEQGPIADPAGEVLQRLARAGVLDLATAKADDEDPCPGRRKEFIVLGAPARAIHLKNAAGQAIVITGGHQHGSLVGVVAVGAAGPSSCGDAPAAAITRLVASLASAPDSTRPHMPPTIGGPMGTPIPPVDPQAPTP